MTSAIIETVLGNNTTMPSVLLEDIHNNTLSYEGEEIKDYGTNLSESITHANVTKITCNQDIYFLCPEPDPVFNTCASIKLKEDLEVNMGNISNDLG